MRAIIPGLRTPYPLETLLPAPFQEDGLTVRLTAGLDDVLAPVVATLDCLHAYLDPQLTPEDFLDWIAGWVGIALDPGWPLERRRATVAQAVPLYRSRGTVEGLRAHVEVLTGGRVELIDTGGVTWSTTPDDGPAAAGDEPGLLVRVTGPDPGANDPDLLYDLVAAAKPAHLPHRVEVLD